SGRLSNDAGPLGEPAIPGVLPRSWRISSRQSARRLDLRAQRGTFRAMTALSALSAAVRLLAGFSLPLFGLGITSYILGRRVAWRLPFAGRLERGAVSTALGLGLTAPLLFLLWLARVLP